jgi:cytochrome oxidase Cu insertion factor (SCO1/SenC/PrrC family)
MKLARSSLPWLAYACAVIITVAGTLAIRQHAAAEEPTEIYRVVPEFVLIDRTGRAVTRRDFLNKISVVDFFYTQCTDACPLQTAQMARLQAEYAGLPALQLVSITVDPRHDDGKTLARYANGYGADPSRWLFLTGPRDVIYRLAVDGFHLAAIAAMPQRPPSAGWNLLTPSAAFAHEREQRPRIIQLAHGSYFAVVDREARIIGYFDSLNADQLRELRSLLDRRLPRRS